MISNVFNLTSHRGTQVRVGWSFSLAAPFTSPLATSFHLDQHKKREKTQPLHVKTKSNGLKQAIHISHLLKSRIGYRMG